jgi:4-hydroxybenzoate polyprenyltransferase
LGFAWITLAVTGGLVALCFVIPLGWPGLWIPAAGGFVAAWFSLRRRSFLAEPILALGLTFLPVAAWQIQDGSTGKGFGLLLLTACLWTVSALVSVRKTHRTSDATLAKLAGLSTFAAIFTLKAAALVAFWLAGRELGLGVFYLIGLGAAGALTLYQLFLAKQRLDERAAALELWWGMAIFCAIAFHYVCGCKPPIPLA